MSPHRDARQAARSSHSDPRWKSAGCCGSGQGVSPAMLLGTAGAGEFAATDAARKVLPAGGGPVLQFRPMIPGSWGARDRRSGGAALVVIPAPALRAG
ncbi:hypothetical protein ATO2_03650 [Roseovarius sp. 22II1-1F6A]|nr:hypothetical protein ATO2_03650 [Roseovarius sp. 22II1-1F6A]